ncbi:MAG TPA: hypothetical protein VL593_17260 [Ramlibacter sp.]|jgi:hypothetical protein|nr:hypothetical protein [Ramlibacter sp.]
MKFLSFRRPLRTFAISAFGCLVFVAYAQDDASVAAERARLKDAREKVEAQYVAEEKACYGKFAVNDCLAKARAKRRETLGDLRRQEIALNDAERKRKAAERQRSIEERNTQQRERDSAGQQSQSQQDRALHANERAASRAAQAASAPERAAEREKQVREKEAQMKASARQREQDAATAAKEHDKRVVEAKEHADKLKEREAQRTKPPASALADPN